MKLYLARLLASDTATKPIIGEVTLALKEESQAIIDTEDQYEV